MEVYYGKKKSWCPRCLTPQCNGTSHKRKDSSENGKLKVFIWHHLDLDGQVLVGRPTRWSLLFIFGFLFWSSSWCLQPNIGVSFSVWPLPRAGMVVLDQFFSKMYFLYIWRSPPKNLTEFWGVLAPQNKVYFRALSISQKMGLNRAHVGKYRWILYDISYEVIISSVTNLQW